MTSLDFDTYYLSLATGGRPRESLEEALVNAPFRHKPAYWDLQVAHDNGCPATEDGRSMAACTCEIVEVTATRIDP